MNAPGDAVAWRQARDAGAVGLVAERGDRARALHADGHRRLHSVGMRAGVDAVAHVDVDEVDAGVIDLDHHFARAGSRGRSVVEAPPLDPADLRNPNSLHADFSFPDSNIGTVYAWERMSQ